MDESLAENVEQMMRVRALLTSQSEEISPEWSSTAAVGARRLSTNMAVVKQWGRRRNLLEGRKMARVRQTAMMEARPTVWLRALMEVRRSLSCRLEPSILSIWAERNIRGAETAVQRTIPADTSSGLTWCQTAPLSLVEVFRDCALIG